MSTDKKFTSFGVDKKAQQEKPTMVTELQQKEKEQADKKGNGALVSPEKVNEAAKETTVNYQKYEKRVPKEQSRLEDALHGITSDEQAQEATQKYRDQEAQSEEEKSKAKK